MFEKLFCFFILAAATIRVILADGVENLKTLNDIIIAQNETKVYSLDEYFTNSNLKFSIINPYKNIFYITLSESFNPLMSMELAAGTPLRKTKSVDSINSYVLLFEDTLIVVHWEQINSIITTSCKKTFLYAFGYREVLTYTENDCEDNYKNPYGNVKCYDFEEIFNQEYDRGATYLVIDCDILDSNNNTIGQGFLYYIIFVTGKRPQIYTVFTQTLDSNDYVNDSRKIVYANDTSKLYRFSPYSLKANPQNTSLLQVFTYQKGFHFLQKTLIPNITQYLQDIKIINGSLLILDYWSNIYLFDLDNQTYTDVFKIQNNEYNIDVTYYQTRLFILTNATVYRLSFSINNTFQLIYQINITNNAYGAHFLTQTEDYLYLLSEKYLSIMRIDDASGKKMIDSLFLYVLPGVNNERNFMYKFPDQALKNTFAIWMPARNTSIIKFYCFF